MGSASTRLFAALAALTASGILLAALVVYVLVALLTALVGPGSVLGTLVDLAYPFLAAGVLLTVILVVSGIGVAWAIAETAVDLGTGRLDAVAGELARHEPELEPLVEALLRGERSPPESDEEALADLRERYAAGEIDEETFERELRRILGEDVADARRGRSREPERVDHR